MQRRGTRVRIPINRDCWELGLTPGERNGVKFSELHIADAVITISPVRNIEWVFNHNIDFSPDAELWIHGVRFENTDWSNDIDRVVVYGNYWKCTFTVDADELQLKVKDTEIPYLYSASVGSSLD